MKLTKIKAGEAMTVEVSGGVARSVAPEDGVLIHLYDVARTAYREILK